jgi:hypothetical protein
MISSLETQENRRDFLKKFVPRVVVAKELLETFVSEGIRAEVRQKVPLCIESTDNTNLISIVCEQVKDPEDQMWLLEGLRSLPAFEEFAPIISEKLKLNGGNVRFLYPGTGCHIAPIIMASNLINAGKISSAEYILTDINRCTFKIFLNNLKYLSQLDPNFKYEPDKIQQREYDGGKEYEITIMYKDKPIKLKYLLNCSGENWFRDEDFQETDVFIQHDPATEIYKLMSLNFQYLKAQVKSSKKPPLIIMEDTRNIQEKDWDEDKKDWVSTQGRKFDLELLGKLQQGNKPYSHRYNEYIQLVNKDKYCRRSEFEVGDICFKNGVILEIYPELLLLSPEKLSLLIDTIILADNMPYTMEGPDLESIPYKRSSDGFKEGENGVDLQSEEFYQDLIQNGKVLLKQMLKISPDHASFLSLKMLLTLLKIRREKIDNSKLLNFFKMLCSFLTNKDQRELNITLKDSETILKSFGKSENERIYLQHDLDYVHSLSNAVQDIDNYCNELIEKLKK